ncbi:MAG: DMT family transporter [Alphaproteobacteria bacterium]|jgi:drug/metabolite transporter (DMT)-like permease|nr:DMT family transporter [Alphaproteobacteria bacterium]
MLNRIKLLLLLVSPATIWGILFIVVTPIFKEVSPLYFALVRYLPSVIVLAIILYFVEGKVAFKPTKRLFLVAIAGAFGLAGFNVIGWIGVSLANGTIAAIFQPLTPLIAILISFILFREKFGLLTFGIIILAFIGVFLAASDGDLSFLVHGEPLGFLLIFLGVVMSVFPIILAPKFKDFSVLRYTAITNLGGIITYLILAIICTEFGYAQLPSVENLMNVKWYLLYATIFTGVFPILLMFRAVKSVGPINAMLFNNLIPVVAIVGSILIGLHVSNYEIIGATIIIVAMTLHYFNVKRNTNVL